MTETKKGRKALGKRSFTYTELRQRQRMKAKLLRDEMDKKEYVLTQAFMHPKQIEALSYLDKRIGGEGLSHTDPTKLSESLFRAVKFYIKNGCKDSEEGEPLDRLVKSGDLPEHSFHEIAKMDAQLKFMDWSKQHIEGLKQ